MQNYFVAFYFGKFMPLKSCFIIQHVTIQIYAFTFLSLPLFITITNYY